MTPAACGTWTSPLRAEDLARGQRRLGFPGFGPDGRLYWVEGRGAEAGRSVLVTSGPEGIVDVTPPPFSVRSRVHEYGGLAYALDDGAIVFVDDAEGRLHRVIPGGMPEAVTAASPWRLGEPVIDRAHRRILCVGERHDPGRAEPENAIVAIDPSAGTLAVLIAGADFYAAPRPGPDGTRLAWLQWNHPHMPWDAAELHVAELDRAGRPTTTVHVAGGPAASAIDPAFDPSGALDFCWEPDGSWNPWRWRDGELHARFRTDAEIGGPPWLLGARGWARLPDGGQVVIANADGLARVLAVDVGGHAHALPLPAAAYSHVAAHGDRIAVLGDLPGHGNVVAVVDRRTDELRIVRRAVEPAVPAEAFAAGEPVSFPTAGDEIAHGFFHPPRSSDFVPLPGELPPLIVTAHGGPTAATSPVPSPTLAFFTTRGFAVLDVNYRGSSGYGRRYRDRLYGGSGVIEVEDCVAGARFLADRGRVDGRRLLIRGSSAGGFVALAAITFWDVFAGACVLYGIADLETLVRDTHKFESRYPSSLVGPWPDAAELYRARSPIHHVDRIRVPLLWLQGLEDRVVPPNQAEGLVAALRARERDVEYRAFSGEGHGFRRADTIATALGAELAFYRRILGLAVTAPAS